MGFYGGSSEFRLQLIYVVKKASKTFSNIAQGTLNRTNPETKTFISKTLYVPLRVPGIPLKA